MKRTPVFSSAFLLAVVSLFGASATLAQDAPAQDAPPQQDAPPLVQSQPKPAGRGYQPFGDDPGDAPDSGVPLKPDITPLTGALVPGIGSPELQHSYWVPGFQYGNFVRSSSLNQPNVSDWNTTSFVGGNVSLLEAWNNSQLTLNYSGGGTFSTDKFQGSSYFHELQMIQAFTWSKWQLSFVDQFSYLPQAQFGFGATSTLAAPGISGSLSPTLQGLQSNYLPSQSIFAALGPRYSNSATAQIVYDTSARGALTLSGSYGLLRFVDPGNIDSYDSIFSAGYNYAVSKKDSIGVLYRFSDYRYVGNPQAIGDHVAQLAYGRKITGRLAFQLFAGPEITTFRVHTPGYSNRTSESGGATLSYFLPRTNFSVNYNHGVAGGSGVFTGSSADAVQGTMNRQLTRVWHGNVSFGFARNSNLNTGSLPVTTSTYDTYFAGAGIDRPVGRTANVSLGYTAYVQDTNAAGCAVLACGSYAQHQVSMSFQWHTRPLVLR